MLRLHNIPLAATHADAVGGVLDFLKPICKQPVIIAEATLSKSGMVEGYKDNGYMSLPEKYNVELIDLAEQPFMYGLIG